MVTDSAASILATRSITSAEDIVTVRVSPTGSSLSKLITRGAVRLHVKSMGATRARSRVPVMLTACARSHPMTLAKNSARSIVTARARSCWNVACSCRFRVTRIDRCAASWYTACNARLRSRCTDNTTPMACMTVSSTSPTHMIASDASIPIMACHRPPGVRAGGTGFVDHLPPDRGAGAVGLGAQGI